MSSDLSVLAGTWRWTTELPDGTLDTMSVNIQVSPGVIQVSMPSSAGAVQADNVIFADGVLNCSSTSEGYPYQLHMKMRQDGNIDVSIDIQGLTFSSVASKVVDGN
jgi:hypothetical protein